MGFESTERGILSYKEMEDYGFHMVHPEDSPTIETPKKKRYKVVIKRHADGTPMRVRP